MPRTGANLIPVVFQPGTHEEIDRQALPIGALSLATNCRFNTQGAITPRAGSNCITPTVTTTDHVIAGSGERPGPIGKIGSIPLLGVAGKMFAQDAAGAAFNFCGLYSSAQVKSRRAGFHSADNTMVRGGQAVSSAGYLLAAVPFGSSIRYFIEAPNGTRIFESIATPGTKCACVAQGVTLIMIFQNGTTLTAVPFTISAGVVTVGAYTTVGTLSGAASYWDCSSYDGTNWFLIYQSSAVVATLIAYNITANSFNTTFATANSTTPFSVWGDAANGKCWVGYCDPGVSGNAFWRMYTVAGAFTLVIGPNTILLALGPGLLGPPLFGPGIGTNQAFFVLRYSNSGTTPFTRAVYAGHVSSIGVQTTPDPAYHVTPVSKPDANQRVWCLVNAEGPNWAFQRVVLLRWRSSNAAMVPMLELAGPETDQMDPASLPSRLYDFFHATAAGTNSDVMLVPRLLQRGPAGTQRDLLARDVYEYSRSSQEPSRQLLEFGTSAVAMGQPVEVFGHGVARYDILGTGFDSRPDGALGLGFAYRPAVQVATQTAAGNLTALSAYQWCFVFEWMDQRGRRHRSAPSVPFALTLTGGNQQVQFQITSLEWDQRRESPSGGGVLVIAYRTLPGGTTFYRETAPAAGAFANGTNGLVAYTSGAFAEHADTAIAKNEVLYTDGGVLDNVLAPAGRFGCRTEERLAVGGQWEPQIVSVSKIIVPGEPIQFTESAAYDIVLPEPCTGLAYQDGAIVAFGQRAIYAVTGDGPDDQGNGGYSPPRAICRDIGCIDARSIIETAEGIFFLAERGIHLLPRGLGQPVFVGWQTQLKQAQFGATSCLGVAEWSYAANGNPGNRHLFFLLGTPGVQSTVLVYNMDMRVWSYDSYARLLGGIGAWPLGPVLALDDLSSALICGYQLISNAGVFDAANGGVATEQINMLIDTGVMHPWGIAGEGRLDSVIALYSRTTNPGTSLIMRLYLDGANTDTVSWIAPVSTLEASYKQLVPAQGHCTDVRVEISCVLTAAAALPRFHGLQLCGDALGERRTTSTER